MLLAFSGIGWKSWKKRWFILTRTSLVFFKSDPVSTSLPELSMLLEFYAYLDRIFNINHSKDKLPLAVTY